jgi:3-oxoacyl-[acyl-carrier protein] reductase
MAKLENKVALVTGSSRGIGATIARRFAREGAKVVVHGRDAAALRAVQKEIEQAGGRALDVAADVRKLDELEALVTRAERELGPIDILVANAGGNYVNPRASVDEISEAEFRGALDDNLMATFLGIKAVLPSMKARKTGNIITISSTAGRRAHPQSPLPYGVAKAGIEMLTQHLAIRVGSNIRVNCIAPESILTERTEARIPEEQKRVMIETHPVKRLGTPDDVAQAALFLASDDSSWITGVVLDVAGGAFMPR